MKWRAPRWVWILMNPIYALFMLSYILHFLFDLDADKVETPNEHEPPTPPGRRLSLS